MKQIDNTIELIMVNQGNTAEIYRYDKNRILKLFRKSIPLELVNKEYQTAQIVQAKLENIPKVYDMVI